MAAKISRTVKSWFQALLGLDKFDTAGKSPVKSKKAKSKRRKPSKKSSIDKEGLKKVKAWMQRRANRGIITTHKEDFERICELNGLNPEEVRLKLASSKIIHRYGRNRFYPFTCLLPKTTKTKKSRSCASQADNGGVNAAIGIGMMSDPF